MGACLGRCQNSLTDCFLHRSYLRHTNVFVDEDEAVEFGQPSSISTSRHNHINLPNSTKKFLSFFSLKKFKKTYSVPIALELIEGSSSSGQHSNYKRFDDKNTFIKPGLDEPLQMLDASELIMNQGYISITPTSSIDLEWEDEGMPTPTIIENNKLQNLDESLSEPTVNKSHPSSLTVSPWSQLSTPNSLEWDPEEADNEDFETDKLLTEIERLTNRALDETAEWVNSS